MGLGVEAAPPGLVGVGPRIWALGSVIGQQDTAKASEQGRQYPCDFPEDRAGKVGRGTL